MALFDRSDAAIGGRSRNLIATANNAAAFLLSPSLSLTHDDASVQSLSIKMPTDALSNIDTVPLSSDQLLASRVAILNPLTYTHPVGHGWFTKPSNFSAGLQFVSPQSQLNVLFAFDRSIAVFGLAAQVFNVVYFGPGKAEVYAIIRDVFPNFVHADAKRKRS